MEFEHRQTSNPYIGRIEYKDFYIYLIRWYIGCNCRNTTCDNYRLNKISVKVREKQTEKLVLSKKGNTRVKIEVRKGYTPEQVLAIAIENFNI